MLKDVDAFDNNIMVTCELGFIENQYLFGAFKVIPGGRESFRDDE